MHNRLQISCWVMIWMLVTAFCLVLPEMAGAGAWKKYDDENGIVGYERKVDGSKFPEVKAEATFDAPMEVLVAVLMDVPRFTKWMYGCRRTERIGKTSDDHQVFYFLQGGPMGSPDRWAIIDAKTVIDFSAGTCVTAFESIDREYQPLEEDAQRMDRFSGKFELKMVSRNRTRVRYTIYMDPGKSAPVRVVKEVTRKVGFETVRNWIAKAWELRYIHAAEKGAVKPGIEKAMATGALKFAVSVE